MNAVSSRLFDGPDDLRQMGELLRVARPEHWHGEFPTLDDLQESMLIPAARANTRLWISDNGALAAFALVDAYHNLIFEMLPGLDPAIERQIVEWGVGCLRREPEPDSPGSLTLDAGCRLDDRRRLAFLRQHGFRELPVQSLTMERDLGEPIPEARVPCGYRIRASLGEQEAERWVALHRAAFGTEFMTVDERLAMIHVPGYDPALDLVAETSAGALAAYCCCAIDSSDEHGRIAGTTDPVATHPDHRGKGLARALLLTGLGLLKARGAGMARLGTSSDNPAMLHVAEGVGFQTRAARLWFEWPVER